MVFYTMILILQIACLASGASSFHWKAGIAVSNTITPMQQQTAGSTDFPDSSKQLVILNQGSFNHYSNPLRQILLHSQSLDLAGGSPTYIAVILVESFLGG